MSDTPRTLQERRQYDAENENKKYDRLRQERIARAEQRDNRAAERINAQRNRVPLPPPSSGGNRRRRTKTKKRKQLRRKQSRTKLNTKRKKRKRFRKKR